MNKLFVLLLLFLSIFNLATFAQDISGTWKVQKVELCYWDLKETSTVTSVEKDNTGYIIFKLNNTGEIIGNEYISCNLKEITWNYKDETPKNEINKKHLTIEYFDDNYIVLTTSTCFQFMDHAEHLRVELIKE